MSADVIKLLPDSVANQIAAGEVIQRPASVIKELVENSIDAGADSVKIILKDAGRTLIQVVDNGRGMSDTDAALAFERHATSKISAASDLFALHTMGFRGEALASIAAIAQIDMRTMPRDEKIGTRILIEGSRVIEQTPEATAPGTNLMVKNLFFNVPARRKFLKKDTVELNNIVREFERLALVNTGVEFTLIHNDVTLQQLRKGSLKNRITDLFGKQLDRQLIEITTDTSIVKISGFIGLPENARKRNPLQYFFVNGRNMRHPYFHKAVMTCYENLIGPELQPNYFINFEVDPASIDVNIHPTKHEIKFEDEQAIWQIIVAAIRESLGRYNAVPGIDFDTDDTPDIPAFAPNTNGEHSIELEAGYNPFDTPSPGHDNPRHTSPSSYRQSALNSMITDWERLYSNFTGERQRNNATPADTDDTPVVESALNINEVPGLIDTPSDNVSGIMQLKKRYILSPASEGLMIVDRYRAGVRVLYDRYYEMACNHRFSTQRVLFPETVELSPAQNAVLTAIASTIGSLGFDIAYLGDNTWSVNGMPAELNGINPTETLTSMIETVTETGDEIEDKVYESVTLSMARSAATRAGRDMTDAEAEHLLGELLRSSSPHYTPDGKPVTAIITDEQLSSLLKA